MEADNFSQQEAHEPAEYETLNPWFFLPPSLQFIDYLIEIEVAPNWDRSCPIGLFEQELEGNGLDVLGVIIANDKEQYLMISKFPSYKGLWLYNAPLYLTDNQWLNYEVL